MRKLVDQVAGNRNADRSDGVRIMPLGTNASPEGGSPATSSGLVIQDFRPGLRGKNGSARRSGTHRLRWRVWRDGETRASLDLHNDPSPVLASVPSSHAQ